MIVLVACLCAALLALGGCSMPTHDEQAAANEINLKKAGISALQAGDSAPALSGALDLSGQPVELDSLLAQHPGGLILFFFPALDAPNSLRNLRDLEKRSVKLAGQGIAAYGVAPAAPEAAAAWRSSAVLGLPLLADPQGSMARAWGCLGAEGGFPQRTTVAVDKQGAVLLFYRGIAPEQSINQAFGL